MNIIINEFKEQEEYRKSRLKELRKLLANLTRQWINQEQIARMIWKAPAQVTRLKTSNKYKMKLSTINKYISLLNK